MAGTDTFKAVLLKRFRLSKKNIFPTKANPDLIKIFAESLQLLTNDMDIELNMNPVRRMLQKDQKILSQALSLRYNCLFVEKICGIVKQWPDCKKSLAGTFPEGGISLRRSENNCGQRRIILNFPTSAMQIGFCMAMQ